MIVAAGCSSSGEAPAPTPAPSAAFVDADAMRRALLQPQDVGKTWTPSQQPPAPNSLVRLCGGDETPPAIPGAPAVVTAPLVDEGTKGAQTLDQIALVYPDALAAAAGLAALRVQAEACPTTLDEPAKKTEERREPAYTETVSVAPLNPGGWSGFVVERHKVYEPAHPASADTAVAVLTRSNVLLVDAYAIYVIGGRSAAPQFAADWRKLVGTTLGRVAG
jgi:hypothetical protein